MSSVEFIGDLYTRNQIPHIKVISDTVNVYLIWPPSTTLAQHKSTLNSRLDFAEITN